MSIIIVAAHARNNAIGRDGKLPWSIKEEMNHFRRVTMGHAVVMGRKTAESIGRFLVGRKNIVLTTQDRAPFPGQIIATSLQEAAEIAGHDEDLYVIGGAQVYRDAFPLADRLIISYISMDVPDADAFLPDVDESVFQMRRDLTEVHASNDPSVPDFAIWTFDRIRT